MANSQTQHISPAAGLLAALLGLFALTLLGVSLGWEYSRDTPLLNYVGFLIWEHGFAPYSDVFETSMPGALAFHTLVSAFGLTGDLGFMVLATIIVVGFSLLGAVAILPFGWSSALIACPLIIIVMLLMGPGWILKIDMVALLPISAALCAAVWQRPASVRGRQFLIGLLFGVAGTMKPHLMLGAPVVVLTAYAIYYQTNSLRDLPRGELIRQVAVSMLGFAVPILLVSGWLLSTGAMKSFVFVLTEYLPLHLEKTDWQEFVTVEEKRRIVMSNAVRFGGYYGLVPMAALTTVLAFLLRHKLTRPQVITLIALFVLTLLYGFAPAVGGQFYVYYYFPFFFFSLLLIVASVSLMEKTALHPIGKSLWILFLAGFLFHFGNRFYSDDLLTPNTQKAVVEMEAALDTWLPEGGRVQPVDWTSGVVHAMLRRKILPATPYLYDYHFHHHVGSEINTMLRGAFITALENKPPEIIMEAKFFPRVSGLNTSERFEQRDSFIANKYRLVADHEAFRVYLHNSLAAP